MSRYSAFWRRTTTLLGATIVLTGLIGPAPTLAGPGHTGIPSNVPVEATPNIKDGNVRAIFDAGAKVIAVGSFTQVQNRGSATNIPRTSVFAFDKATGVVDTAFAPVVDGVVNTVIGGPTPGTAYIGGTFNTVNGVTRRKVALLNVSNGALVGAFKGPTVNAAVNDLVLTNGRLLLGGAFTLAAGQARNGLMSMDAATGTVTSYLTVAVTGNHNWNGTGAKAPVGVDKLAISPDGSQLVVIGNFKNANGVLHDQIVKLDLGADAATIANWNTDRFTPRCASGAFDSWVRDVAYSPDGSYFVVVSTGGYFAGTLCDTAARFASNVTATNAIPAWVNTTGGDTLLSVSITEQAVYVGGHIRWMNNSLGRDAALAGAIPRPSLAALDPVSGMPLKWLPGRHPRGFGIGEIYATPEGLWLGYDTDWMGNFQYRRERIAFLPMTGAGAYTPHGTNAAGLPGNVVFAGAGAPTNVLYRVNACGPALTSIDGGPDWAGDALSSPSPYVNFTATNCGLYTPVGSVDGTVPVSTPSAVFSDERYDLAAGADMMWDFAVPAGTQIEVRLYFANRSPFTSLPGKRVFHIDIDNVRRLTNFDIVVATGHNRGTMKSFAVTSDGNVDIDFRRAVESPKVDAIEIVSVLPPATANAITSRAYDGNTAVGPVNPIGNPDGTAWSAARGAFWVGGTLFTAMNGTLNRRTFDGTTFGAPTNVDPYHDPVWDTVITDSGPLGQTYAGLASNFYGEIPGVTGMFYSQGRIFYTLAGQSALFWRWFSPDSGGVGSDKFTVTGTTQFLNSGGVFVSAGKLYLVSRLNGSLSRMDFVNNAPVGTPTVISGPAVDGVDWRAKAVFVSP